MTHFIPSVSFPFYSAEQVFRFGSSDIEKTFAKPVSEIASLIDDQINLAEAKGAKVSVCHSNLGVDVEGLHVRIDHG